MTRLDDFLTRRFDAPLNDPPPPIVLPPRDVRGNPDRGVGEWGGEAADPSLPLQPTYSPWDEQRRLRNIDE